MNTSKDQVNGLVWYANHVLVSWCSNVPAIVLLGIFVWPIVCLEYHSKKNKVFSAFLSREIPSASELILSLLLSPISDLTSVVREDPSCASRCYARRVEEEEKREEEERDSVQYFREEISEER